MQSCYTSVMSRLHKLHRCIVGYESCLASGTTAAQGSNSAELSTCANGVEWRDKAVVCDLQWGDLKATSSSWQLTIEEEEQPEKGREITRNIYNL